MRNVPSDPLWFAEHTLFAELAPFLNSVDEDEPEDQRVSLAMLMISRLGDSMWKPPKKGTFLPLDEDERKEYVNLWVSMQPLGTGLKHREFAVLASILDFGAVCREEAVKAKDAVVETACADARLREFLALRAGVAYMALRQSPLPQPGEVAMSSDCGILIMYQHLTMQMAARAETKAARERAAADREKKAREAERQQAIELLAERRKKRKRIPARAQRVVVQKVTACNPNASASVRVGLDPRVTYRIIARDNAVDVVGVDETGVPLAHDLGNAEHLGPLRAMVTMPVAGQNGRRPLRVEPITAFDETQPTGGLDLTAEGTEIV